VNFLSYEEETLGQWVAFESVVLPVKISFTYFVAYLLMPRLLYRKRYQAFFLVSLLSLVCFGSLLYLVYTQVVHPIIMEDILYHKASPFIYKGLELIYIASIFIGFKFFQNYYHQQAQNQILIKEKAEAELKYLRNQIQPHFLFNTLNNIYGLVLSDDKQAASDTIVAFSNLLSYMLYESNVAFVPLEKELHHLETYIELEKLRYRKRLTVNYDKEINQKETKIAPLLLIPLIENAFKHGPAKEKGASFISIALKVDSDKLTFIVENSYKKQKSTSSIRSGIGLENVKKRLELLYSGRHSLAIDDMDSTFSVSLTLMN